MINLDTITHAEFRKLWGRICVYVNMKDAFDAEEMDNRMRNHRHKLGEAKKESESKRERKALGIDIRNLRRLEEKGFSRRAEDEAIANPRGEVAQTIRHGWAWVLRRRKERMKHR